MLRIIAQKSSSAAQSYYSTADYFTEGHELQGIWRGKGAEHLGLSGTIEQEDWDLLCENINPNTGEQLTARKVANRRVGWDFNFGVPKSLSLLYALTKDQKILDAFTESVDETISLIESELQTRVRTLGQDRDRLTGNAVWGRYIHTTSRPVDGIPDPHLHAHCFLFNATYDSEENQWKAAQIAGIKRDANYFNAYMHSRLASKLVELGIPIERTTKSWQIGVLGEEVEQKFSRRTKQINELADQLGITDPDEKAALGALTRDRKNKNLSFDQLRTLWLSWLTSDESDSIQQLQQGIHSPAQVQFNDSVAKEAIQHAVNHHFERQSVIPERKLLTTALHQSIGQSTPEQVLNPSHLADFITGESGGQRLLTTEQVLEEETQMLNLARNGKGTADRLVPIDQIQIPDWFNPDQKQAMHHLCTAPDKIMLLRGVAGAGKTTLLSELRTQILSTGKKLLAFAPGSEASHKVLKEAGFENAETVAMLLKNPKLQQSLQDQVLLIDEAGQLGTRQMLQIFELALQHNARIILSGDSQQHKSVERGSALRLLEEETGLQSAKLTEIMRQKDRYKQVSAYLNQGRVKPAFDLLNNLKWIHEVDDNQTRYERIAAEYIQAIDANQSVLVTSPTHHECQKVTEAIRSALHHENLIGRDETSLLKLTNSNLTPAQLKDKVNYADGDIIIFNQNATGYTKGTRLTVGIDPIPIDLSDRYTLYHPSQLSVSTGDLIRITGVGTSIDNHRLNNGSVYKIQSIKTDGTLVFTNGWHVGPQFGKIDHGYCSTSHASQGKTVQRIIIAQSSESFPAASKEQFYVSVSRGRTQCSIYTDDKENLFEAVSESSDEPTATELVARSRTYERIRQNLIQESVQPHMISNQTKEQHTYER